MDITPEQVRAHRLRAHHLDRRYPASRILEAAGACGLQNSPPGGRDKARPPGIPPAGRTIRPGRSAFPQRGEHFRRDTLYILFPHVLSLRMATPRLKRGMRRPRPAP